MKCSITRQDRQGRQRGGVSLFLREDLTGETLCSHSNGVCEVLVMHVHQLNTIVTIIYRPPETCLSEFASILNMLEKVFQKLPLPAPTITIMGDLNFPSSAMTWQMVDGVLLPRVDGHRLSGHDSSSEGGLVEQQAVKLVPSDPVLRATKCLMVVECLVTQSLSKGL